MNTFKVDDIVIIKNSCKPSRVGRSARVVAVDQLFVDVVFLHDYGPDAEIGRFTYMAEDLSLRDRTDLMQEIADSSPMEKAGLDLTDAQVKDSNPKDGCGAKKPPLSYIPRTVLYEVGNALFEGSRKYGAYNWRIAGVRASIYQDACGRHLDAWHEGQDLDPDSGIHHVSKAIAGLIVIRDAMICDKFVDDRPPSAPADWMEKAQAQTDAIIERHPTSKAPYTQIRKDAGAYDDMV